MKKVTFCEPFLGSDLGRDDLGRVYIDVDEEKVTFRTEDEDALFETKSAQVLGIIHGKCFIEESIHEYKDEWAWWYTNDLLLSGTCQIYFPDIKKVWRIEWEPIKINPCPILSEILEAEIVLEKNFCFYAENYSRFHIKLTVHDMKVEKVSVIKTERYVYSGLGDPARFKGSFTFYVKEEIDSILGFMTKQVCWGLEVIGLYLIKKTGEREIVACPCDFDEYDSW